MPRDWITPDERRRRHAEYMRRWLHRNPDAAQRARDRAMRWGQQFPGRAARNKYVSRLRRKYGVSFETYTMMVLAQQGQCALCDVITPDLDFDRRGLLCPPCTSLLAFSQENLEILGRAMAYLGGLSS